MDGMNTVFEFVVVVKCCNILLISHTGVEQAVLVRHANVE